MADIQLSTAGNRPELTAIEPVEEIRDEYFLRSGSHDTVTAEVGPEIEPPVLRLYGCGSFAPVYIPILGRESEPDANSEILKHEYMCEDTEAFLDDIAPHLAEPLVIQTVGFTECRFPHTAYQYTVSPDGDIDYQTLEH